MLQSIQEDTQSTSKLCQSLANMKADKKEINDFRAKMTSQVQETVTGAEFTATVSNMNSDITQKLLDLFTQLGVTQMLARVLCRSHTEFCS